jgi:hypothetical protein
LNFGKIFDPTSLELETSNFFCSLPTLGECFCTYYAFLLSFFFAIPGIVVLFTFVYIPFQQS